MILITGAMAAWNRTPPFVDERNEEYVAVDVADGYHKCREK